MNKLVLNGEVGHLESLRHTPAGLPLLSFAINHTSEDIEAGLNRKVECEVNAVIMGELAKTKIQLGDQIKAAGFLAKRSAKSTQLVMHIQKLEILKNI